MLLGQSARYRLWCFAASPRLKSYSGLSQSSFFHCVQTQQGSLLCLGEVSVTKVVRRQKVARDKGYSKILAIECQVSGSAKGRARVQVYIHSRFATFDDEKWRLITMTGRPFDHATQYTDLFAASCGSIGEFLDSKKYDDMMMGHMRSLLLCGTIMSCCGESMGPGLRKFIPSPRTFSTPRYIRSIDAFNWNISKIHPNCSHAVPKYWPEDDGTMSFTEASRWRSTKTLKWLKTNGMTCVPPSIKAELRTLVRGSSIGAASSSLTPPPGL